MCFVIEIFWLFSDLFFFVKFIFLFNCLGVVGFGYIGFLILVFGILI